MDYQNKVVPKKHFNSLLNSSNRTVELVLQYLDKALLVWDNIWTNMYRPNKYKAVQMNQKAC